MEVQKQALPFVPARYIQGKLSFTTAEAEDRKFCCFIPNCFVSVLVEFFSFWRISCYFYICCVKYWFRIAVLGKPNLQQYNWNPLRKSADIHRKKKNKLNFKIKKVEASKNSKFSAQTERSRTFSQIQKRNKTPQGIQSSLNEYVKNLLKF